MVSRRKIIMEQYSVKRRQVLILCTLSDNTLYFVQSFMKISLVYSCI